jgi:hypothetical protein
MFGLVGHRILDEGNALILHVRKSADKVEPIRPNKDNLKAQARSLKSKLACPSTDCVLSTFLQESWGLAITTNNDIIVGPLEC